MSELYKPNESILLCGGKGSRFVEITGNILPKSLVEINGKTLLQHSLAGHPPSLISSLVFAVDFQAQQIVDWVRQKNIHQATHFSYQADPGLAPAIQTAAAYVQRDEMTTCNTDEIRLGLPLASILATFARQMEEGKLATMVVTPADHLYRHRLVHIRERDGHIMSTQLKPEEYRNRPDAIGFVNTGFFVFSKKALEHIDLAHSRDWSGLTDPLCNAGLLGAHVVRHMPYFNVGTVEEFEEATAFFKNTIAA